MILSRSMTMPYAFVNPDLATAVLKKLASNHALSFDLDCPAFATYGEGW